MTEIAGWALGSFTADDTTHPTYRRGTGPGVIVIHEIPGITEQVEQFGNEVVDAGFTVVMPDLFGRVGQPDSMPNIARSMVQVCVSREFTTLALNQTTPVAGWLRALARDLHDELGGPGVGAVGMCFTGGFALAMMVDAPVVAPVLSQPSVPFAIGRKRSADLGLSPDDLAVVTDKVAAGCQVLGLRYKGDRAVGARFDTLRATFGNGFVPIEFDGNKHSVLTAHRQQAGVDAVIAFLHDKLDG